MTQYFSVDLRDFYTPADNFTFLGPWSEACLKDSWERESRERFLFTGWKSESKFRPCTNLLHHFVWKKKKWQVTCDTRHITCDKWHVTRDMWHLTNGGWWTFFQNFSYLALTVWDRQCLQDISTKDESLNQSINQLINYEGTEYRVQSKEYRVQSIEYRVQSTEYWVQSTEYRAK